MWPINPEEKNVINALPKYSLRASLLCIKQTKQVGPERTNLFQVAQLFHLQANVQLWTLDEFVATVQIKSRRANS
jgi:hypothetical protein